jgi:Cu-Zn family superoxide dismutase
MPVRLCLLLGALALACGCTSLRPKAPTASTTLAPRSGSTVTGSARFTQGEERVRIHLELHGLAANSAHGVHIHEKGDCSAADAASAGGHYNPTATTHGSPDSLVHHAGDLPVATADAHGDAKADFVIRDVTLAPGPTSIVGRSLVVHRDVDDYLTQPSGNSGPRIACGVIVAP